MTVSKSSPILLRKQGDVLHMTLNRPAQRNALTQEMLLTLIDGYRMAQQDAELRAILITAEGDQAFCAGADLSGPSAQRDYSKPNSPFADLLRVAGACTLPVLARVNGSCMAGGMGLLAMADLAVAADDARFGLPEPKVGLFPMQVVALLQQLVPPRTLREWCLTAEPFDAAAALAAGLLNYVVPRGDLDSKTAWLLSRLTDKSPSAVRRGKYALRAIADMTCEQSLAYMESQFLTLALTEDAREGRAAFNEKRPPEWTGR